MTMVGKAYTMVFACNCIMSMKLADTSPPNDTRHSLAVTLPVEGEAETIRELRKKLVTLQSRIKELTAINEQWALESQEKASEMKIVQIQLDDAE